MRLAIGFAFVLFSVACHRPPSARVAAAGPPGFDSATTERLCEAPDSVRAGTRSCVLRDQAARVVPIFRGPRRVP